MTDPDVDIEFSPHVGPAARVHPSGAVPGEPALFKPSPRQVASGDTAAGRAGSSEKGAGEPASGRSASGMTGTSTAGLASSWVDSPILGSPYLEPSRHWSFGAARPVLSPGRRPSGDVIVEDLRRRVGAWRQAGYPGATAVTRRLLRRWASGERLFFAQREAVETVAYLHECATAPRDGDIPRMACRLATGAGKTAVMGALVAWQLLNHQAYPRDPRFTGTALILCPNLMVRHRLGEVSPNRGEASVYRVRDLVTRDELVALRRGRVRICTWHALLRRDLSDVGGVSARVIARGIESDQVMTRRLLGPGRGRILVLNDEAHHAHRSGVNGPTVWADGLDALNTTRGIGLCVDLTATPTDPVTGEILPWLISSFPLADAIECGLVKLPQVPVIMPPLPWSKGAAAICEAAAPALAAMVERYRETARRWEHEIAAGLRPDVPPLFAVVCRDIALARAVHAHLTSTFPEFRDALRLDSRAIEDADHLRWTAATVGLESWPGGVPPAEYVAEATARGADPTIPPGRHVRCVVSVAMLAEGWDARNVTHLVGLRPFGSALLVEQVVGRGLRRSRPGAYGAEEIVDVAGVPFEEIPLRADPDRPERPVIVPPPLPAEAAPCRAPVPAEPLDLDPDLLRSSLETAGGTTPQQRAYQAALTLTRLLESVAPPHVVFPKALDALRQMTS